MAKKAVPIVPTPPPKVPTPTPKSISPMMPLVAIAFAVIGGLIGYFLFKTGGTTTTNNTANTNTTTNTTLNTNSAANTNTVANTNSANTNTSTVTATATWNIAKVITSKNLLPTLWGPVLSDKDGGIAPVYYSIGTISTTKYADASVIMVAWYGEGPQFYPSLSYFLKLKDGSYVYPTTMNKDIEPEGAKKAVFPQKTVVDLTYDPILPVAPKTLKGPKAHQTLVADNSGVEIFSAKNLSVAFSDATVGPVYWYGTKAYTIETDMIGRVPITMRGGFYVQSPIGLTWSYHLKYDFLTKTTDDIDYYGVPSITWTDGTKNVARYNTSTVGGCGILNYADVVDSVSMTALMKIGVTSTGDDVYQYTDTNAKELKDYYTNTYQVTGDDKKVAYADFLADYPILFFKDSFGRLLRMTNDAYKPMAECGKPVVYLYPTSAMNVSVQLAPVGGFSKTEPAYGTGWNVFAQPNGQLKNLADGKMYPYLFWEGRGGLYTEPEQGFVVPQANVHSFLVSSLGKLGLNAVETKDFIEFWEPRMQGSPYYKVSFLGTQTMNELAPMTVTPTPDTVIRVLMDFRPLSKKISIPEQRLGHIPRNGFTVLEWGGVLR